jgi:hypothetical protein
MSETKNFGDSCGLTFGHVLGLGGQALKPFIPQIAESKERPVSIAKLQRTVSAFLRILTAMGRKRKAAEVDSSSADRTSKRAQGLADENDVT